jgi:hypothetical protein
MYPKHSIDFVSDYSKIIEVNFYHNFFKNNNFEFLKISPNFTTISLLKQYGLIFREKSNGFILIMENNNKFSSSSFKGEITLLFDFIIKDSFFFNYTNIDNDLKKIMVFTNKFENNLHSDLFVSDNDLVLNDNTDYSGQINLSINKLNEYFGYGKNREDIVENTYNVRFDSRELVFRYNFFSEKENLSSYYITDEDGNFTNNSFYKRLLASGKEVFSLIYNEKQKACEQYKIRHFLRKNNSAGELNSYNLPLSTPKIENIAFDHSTNNFYADIFSKIV